MKEQKAKFRKYYNPDRKDLSHWLTGIVRCEKCGAVLSNQGGFFGCSKRSRGTCKGVGYIKAEKLDGIIFNILSDITIPNVEFEFAEPKSDTHSNDDSAIISTQIQRLEIRLERVRLAYEDGADTLEEYKENKKSILSEIDGLKKALKKSREKISKGKDEICKKDIRRLTDLLQDASISNTEKNKTARTIFKEIIKGGEDGKTLKCVFWR